jgi:hypothetical protein
MHWIDVKIAFLNGDLDEKVYMKNSKGLLSMVKKRKFVSLSTYYMVWNKHLNNVMKSLTRLLC